MIEANPISETQSNASVNSLSSFLIAHQAFYGRTRPENYKNLMLHRSLVVPLRALIPMSKMIFDGRKKSEGKKLENWVTFDGDFT